MKIIEPSFKVLTPFGNLTPAVGEQLVKYIERMARISHRSESGQTDDSWKRFIDAVVLGHGDWSVVEHASATVIFRVDRGITHELVRHRLFSFTQESTRFVRYKDELEFIMPVGIADNANAQFLWRMAVKECENTYKDSLGAGARPQEARSVLPNALAATIAVTGNLRNWRLFLLSRVTQETHPDMKRVTIPLLEEFKKNIPLLFDDIEPNAKQNKSLAKVR